MIIGSGRPDPFQFNEWIAVGPPFGVGYSATTGKTLRSSTVFTPASTKCLITGGQSNMSTSCGTAVYSTVSSNAHQLNIYDGGIYLGSDAVLGCNLGNTGPSSINMRIADSMISRGKCTSCVVIPIAIGGTKFEQWVPTASFSLYTRITAAILRARARGLEPDAIFWGQGESDANANGNTPTSAASITASITAIVTDLRAAPISWAGPFYVGYYTMLAGVINSGLGTGTSAGVRKGIFDSISVPLNIVGGFDADNNCPAGGRIDPPGTHLGDAQLATAATAWTTIAFP